MAKVIAVQEIQLKMFNDNYKKNCQKENVVNLNESIKEQIDVPTQNVSTISPIDMESQVVNLNSQFDTNPNITNNYVTQEVFGTQENSVNDSTIIQENTTPSVVSTENANFAVPYQEPTDIKSIPTSVLSDDLYYELLNSLRNMITDFANNAYAAIDRFQEERLQGKSSGVDLINGVSSNKEMILEDKKDEVVLDNKVSNLVDDHPNDLDNTVVLPADFIANNLSETDNEYKMVA